MRIESTQSADTIATFNAVCTTHKVSVRSELDMDCCVECNRIDIHVSNSCAPRTQGRVVAEKDILYLP